MYVCKIVCLYCCLLICVFELCFTYVVIYTFYAYTSMEGEREREGHIAPSMRKSANLTSSFTTIIYNRCTCPFLKTDCGTS